MKKIQKKRLLIGVVIAVIGGIIMFSLHHKNQLEKQAELERNREYEVSLVNALKNSYEGIEEIRIADPKYTEKPGLWSCKIAIKFIEGKNISYGINHQLDYDVNHGGRQQTNEDWEYLENHKGKTISSIKVIYSDNRVGMQ